ncbi:MAG: trypsin-like serine protease, partial [Verrucomicrobiales bacterium]
MRPVIRKTLCAVAVAGLSLACANALQIRSYNSARHDRFTGFPGSPVVNGSAWFDGSKYSGVGWWVNDPQRQFALVSPRHILMASHWSIPVGGQVRFLDQTGALYTATVASLTNVVKDSQATDITIARLNATVPNAAILKYLNLPEKNHYFTSNLQVFGWNGSGGNHPVVGKGILGYIYNEHETPLNIRLSEFGYVVASGDQDDCFFIGGDSGSPTFAETRNGPALIGIHYGVDALAGNVVNY